jgi:nicotinate-nucleotide pyrophosphorylase (carboxylating)
MKKMHELHDSTISRLIEQALFEDIGFGDVTTDSTIPDGTLGTAHIQAMGKGVVAGLEVAGLVFRYSDMQVTFTPLVRDGEFVGEGKTVAHIHGPLRGIIRGMQTAENFLMRLSGIATLTREYVDRIRNTDAKITATRYTIPTLRMLDHFAVKAGGGYVRSIGLDQEIVITKSHRPGKGDLIRSIESAFTYIRHHKLQRTVSVEVYTFDELRDIVPHADRLNRIILCNFAPPVLPQAVDAIAGKTFIEASGGITPETVRSVAEAGVHYIMVPELTHSPRSFPFSFRISS